MLLLGFLALSLWTILPALGPNLAKLPAPGFSCSHIGTAPANLGASLEELCALTVRKGPEVGGYQREMFGAGWLDLDGDGCDTRAEILARDFTSPRFQDHGKPCRLTGGTLHDPYTGKTMEFEGAPGKQVQIDHVVALGNAWKSGAWQWTKPQREAYANDPQVLLAVDGPANQDKSDADAATWLPPNRSFHCAYARHQIDIKYRWGLSVTGSEKAALLVALTSC